MKQFLEQSGWRAQQALPGDASARRYVRVEKNGYTALFMEMGGRAPAKELADFVRIARWLRGAGLKAPDIYEADEKAGRAIIEDFGDLPFHIAIEQGAGMERLYGLAAEVLEHLAMQENLPDLPVFENHRIYKNHRLVIEWYLPCVQGIEATADITRAYLEAWADVEKSLPACPHGFVHGDFHAGNLMFLPGEKGLYQCGIIDFQSAMYGPQPYDLGNLLEDVRCAVPEALRARILKGRDEAFRASCRALTTQFHCRALGQFVKMALEGGQPGYLRHLPRAGAYLEAGLKDPVLKPLARFFDGLKLDFKASGDMNHIRKNLHAVRR